MKNANFNNITKSVPIQYNGFSIILDSLNPFNLSYDLLCFAAKDQDGKIVSWINVHAKMIRKFKNLSPFVPMALSVIQKEIETKKIDPSGLTFWVWTE